MSADDVHREEYRGYTIRLVPDPDPENPREEWDNVGTMRCWHRRYNLGDRPEDGRERYPDGLLRLRRQPSLPGRQGKRHDLVALGRRHRPD